MQRERNTKQNKSKNKNSKLKMQIDKELSMKIQRINLRFCVHRANAPEGTLISQSINKLINQVSTVNVKQHEYLFKHYQ